MKIRNATFDINSISSSDCLICAFGYEERSFHLFDKLNDYLNTDNIIAFLFDDYEQHHYTAVRAEELQKTGLNIITINYSQYDLVLDNISTFLATKIELNNSYRIYIDYSSMPRSWYCRINSLLKNTINNNMEAIFCYTEGIYPNNGEPFPTAGIDSFSVFCGQASLNPIRRTHLLAIGYDMIRSQAISAILDPEKYIAVIASDLRKPEIERRCRDENQEILSRALQVISLNLNDFEFMISKTREIINDLLMYGDVVVVPDGPKPLILAMSMSVETLDAKGLTCLHISRNEESFYPVNVLPTDDIICFAVDY